MKNKLDNLKKQLQDALIKFKDVMQKEKDEYIRDSAIQRFEFTFELCWKTLKVYLGEKGVRIYSPKDAIKEAFQADLIDEDLKWLAMIETRNLTSHVYNEAMAEKVYEALADYVPLIDSLVKKIN